MTAHDQMRAMLDQLMGTGRNGTYYWFWNGIWLSFVWHYYLQLSEISYKNTRWWLTPFTITCILICLWDLITNKYITILGENNKFQVKYSDPKVCKSFLLACCPHEILSSTVSLLELLHIEYRWHTIGTSAL